MLPAICNKELKNKNAYRHKTASYKMWKESVLMDR